MTRAFSAQDTLENPAPRGTDTPSATDTPVRARRAVPPHEPASAISHQPSAIFSAFSLQPSALIFALLLAFLSPWTQDAALTSSICRELLAGTNEGRQALLGSAWCGLPGPLLTLLPAALFGATAFAVRLAAALGWFITFAVAGRSSRSQRPLSVVALQLFTAAAAFAGGAGADPQAAAFAACGLYALRCAADWCESHRMRDIIGTGAGLAGLALCGTTGWLATAALFLLFISGIATAPAALRKRAPAILLLAALPMVYAFGVWTLMNRLVFGDAFFFLRTLAAGGYHAMPDTTLLTSSPAGLAALFILYAFVASLMMRNRALATTGFLLLLLCAAFIFLDAWPMPALTAMLCVGAAWFVWRARHLDTPRVPWTAAGYIAVLFAAGFFCQPRYDAGDDAEYLAGVLETMESRTPYGRLFVCGYQGLILLDAMPPDTRVRPSLDLHVNALRESYHGQTLFLLVPKPAGRGRTDAVHRSHPTPRHFSRDRAINAGYNSVRRDWELYEVVGAPTEQQLLEWGQ